MVVTRIKWILGGFHRKVERRISGKMYRRQAERTWDYLTLGNVQIEDGIEEIETYIPRRQKKVEQYIATCPIQNL